MPNAQLTFRSIQARPVLLKLRRPVAAHIATISEWPVILIDLTTEEALSDEAIWNHMQSAL
jgi:mandelate racemase